MIVKPALAAMLASGLIMPERPALILPKPAIVKAENIEFTKHLLLGMPLTMGMLAPKVITTSILFVASTETTSAGAVTSVTINKPTGTASGDIIVIGVVGGHITMNSTFTLTGFTEQMDVGVVTNCALYTKTAGASEPASYTITCSNSARFAAVCAVYRSASVGVIGSVSANATGSSVAAPSITVAANSSLLLGLFFANQDSNPAEFTAPAGMSLVIRDTDTANVPAIAMFSQVVNSGITGDKTSSINIASGARAILMSLSP